MIIHCFPLVLFGILACFLASTVADEAIIGGEVAGGLDFAYQVSIEIPGFGHGCSGAIINQESILTAATCVIGSDRQLGATPIFILAGTRDLHNTNSPAQRIQVSKIYVPMRTTVGDIAVLKLIKTLQLSKHNVIDRIGLPINQEKSFEGETATIAGYGWSWIHKNGHHITGGRNDSRLRHINAKVLSHVDCTRNHPRLQITENYLCAKVEQHNPHAASGLCVGDGGSPLVVNKTVIGIFNTGPYGCNETVNSGIYTRISHFIRFIRNAKQEILTGNMLEYKAILQ